MPADPVILLDPFPRKIERIFDEATKRRLEKVARVLWHDGAPAADDHIDRHLPHAIALIGQSALAETRTPISKEMPMKKPTPKNLVCLWYNKDALEAARFYETVFPDTKVTAVHKAPGDYPSGKEGDVLTVEFTVMGIPCLGLNGGDAFSQSEAFSFQVATDTQEETDKYWNAIVQNGGQESACGWCKDKWGLSWQITPRVLTEAIAAGGDQAKRAFAAMMEMGKIDVAKIEAARRG